MAAIPDDCERTATVALPTAASAGFISGELGTIAALDAFSTVYELPLTCFEIRQTDKQTDMNDHYTSLYATPTRGNKPTYGHERSLYLAILATPTQGKNGGLCRTLTPPTNFLHTLAGWVSLVTDHSV